MNTLALNNSMPYSVRMPRQTKGTRFEMRLSPIAVSIIETLSAIDGTPKAQIVETALRRYADTRNLAYPGSELRPPVEQPHTVNETKSEYGSGG